MNLKIWELASIILSALVGGMYWGPWLALSRSLGTFEPELFLAIVNRMNRNMESVMTILTPVALSSIIPVLYFSRKVQPRTFYLNLAGFVLFTVALLVTMLVEVPIVKQLDLGTGRSFVIAGRRSTSSGYLPALWALSSWWPEPSSNCPEMRRSKYPESERKKIGIGVVRE
jgi:uncharacterized membrane protein